MKDCAKIQQLEWVLLYAFNFRYVFNCMKKVIFLEACLGDKSNQENQGCIDHLSTKLRLGLGGSPVGIKVGVQGADSVACLRLESHSVFGL